jgi:hypothetical protein
MMLRVGLASINPLLGRVSSLTEGDSGAVTARFVPDGWALPYTAASVWVDPMCLRLTAASPVLGQLVSGEGVGGGGQEGWSHTLVRHDSCRLIPT